MDTARAFSPHTILLWRPVANHPQTQRILKLFPRADVKLIEHQRPSLFGHLSMGQALCSGKRTLMIGQACSFIRRFEGELGSSVNCCPYYKLVPLSNGCPYHCTYCYLAFVYRKYAPFIKLNVNYDTMFDQIRKAAASSSRADFNMGEMLDSLALDHITNLAERLVPFFATIPNGYLLLLTKSSNISGLLAVEANAHTIVSWSLNSQIVSDTYEPGTASLTERVAAAKKLQQHGYRIRFRIDPAVIYPGWRTGYAELIQTALAATRPENITLGMLRFIPGHDRLAIEAYGNRARKLYAAEFVKGASDNKLRYPPSKRIEFYDFVISIICSFDKTVSIGLCRESPDVWEVFKDRCEPRKCNCVTW
jgi:spore photoproduct lyase